MLYQITKQLAEDEPWALTVLPGSGINATTVGSILDALLPHGLLEIHLSGGCWSEGDMQYRPEGMGMGVGGAGEWGVWGTTEEKVRDVRLIADAVWHEHFGSTEISADES